VSRVPLSVCVITLNEEDTLGACLDSVSKIADEIVVLDSGSTDRTEEIARAKNAVVHRHGFDGFGAQKQRAVDLAKNDWILFLDADERISDPLSGDIAALLDDPGRLGRFPAYRILRINHFLGKPIRHGGWEDDELVRLFDRRKAGFDGKVVHEEVSVRGTSGRLGSPLYHDPARSADEFVRKNLRYSLMKARTRPSVSGPAGVLYMIAAPPAVFFRMYVLKLGFLDGLEGFLLASLYGFFALMKGYYRITAGTHRGL
jgi:(heptosyl)LPS beta-1,4-glucosyltransferase